MTQSAARVVVVTGASSGIGLATANRLAADGWRVFGASRSKPAPTASPVQHVAMDVTSDNSVAGAIEQVLSEAGRIDALVHAAGISVAGSVEDMSLAEAEQQFATNYFGAVRVVRAVLPGMRERRRGRIVVIGSIGGLIGLPFLGHYSASKFALAGMIEALRIEIAPFGLEASIVHPGDIRTGISANQIEATAAGEGSAYRTTFRRAVETYDKAVREARGPETIADHVAKLLQRRKLPPRVIAGTAIEHASVVLKALLPPAWFEAILKSHYRL